VLNAELTSSTYYREKDPYYIDFELVSTSTNLNRGTLNLVVDLRGLSS
jgi:hypothetical protein